MRATSRKPQHRNRSLWPRLAVRARDLGRVIGRRHRVSCRSELCWGAWRGPQEARCPHPGLCLGDSLYSHPPARFLVSNFSLALRNVLGDSSELGCFCHQPSLSFVLNLCIPGADGKGRVSAEHVFPCTEMWVTPWHKQRCI